MYCVRTSRFFFRAIDVNFSSIYLPPVNTFLTYMTIVHRLWITNCLQFIGPRRDQNGLVSYPLSFVGSYIDECTRRLEVYRQEQTEVEQIVARGRDDSLP